MTKFHGVLGNWNFFPILQTLNAHIFEQDIEFFMKLSHFFLSFSKFWVASEGIVYGVILGAVLHNLDSLKGMFSQK